MKLSLLVALLAFCFPLALVAQNKDESEAEWKPKPPFIAPIPEFAAWNIKVSIEKKDDQNPGAGSKLRVGSISSIRTEYMKRDVLKYTNGNATQIWYVKNFVIIIAPNGDISFDSSDSLGLKYMVSAFSAPGYPFADWLNASNFVGVEKLQSGRMAAIYEQEIDITRNKISSEAELTKPEIMTYEDVKKQEKGEKKKPNTIKQMRRAFVDVKTNRPIMIQVGRTRMNYQFLPAPTAMLKLPKRAREEFRRLDEQVKAVNRLRAVSKAGR